MMMIWSMSGVPRTIQTMILMSARSGVMRLIEPKLISRPSGRANTSVRQKSCTVVTKPPIRLSVTLANMSFPLYLFFTLFPLTHKAEDGSPPSALY